MYKKVKYFMYANFKCGQTTTKDAERPGYPIVAQKL